MANLEDKEYYWTIVEVTCNGFIYGYHFLTVDKPKKEEINDISALISSGNMKIPFMSVMDLNRENWHSTPFEPVTYDEIKVIYTGSKLRSYSFFVKNYPKSLPIFNILDLKNMTLQNL